MEDVIGVEDVDDEARVVVSIIESIATDMY